MNANEDMNDFITIVSGLPRSGTSMMMRMLESGGIPTMIDHVREQDEDNPRGYYEFEPVKKTREDDTWTDDALGRVVKMVYLLLYDLPDRHQYRIVFMRRELEEVLKSQQVMLERHGQTGGPADETMMELFTKELAKAEQWLAGKPNMSVLNIKYNDMFEDAAAKVSSINAFLGGNLNEQAMGAVVEPSLYRNRKA